MSQIVTNSYRYAGENCFESYSYQNDSDNQVMASWCSTRDANGITVVAGSSLIGMKPTYTAFKLGKNGAGMSCGTITCRIVADGTNGSTDDTPISVSTNSYASTSISNEQVVEFTMDGSVTIAEGNAIAVHTTDASTCGNCWSGYLTVRYQTSQSADSAEFRINEYNAGGWEVGDADRNLYFKMCG